MLDIKFLRKSPDEAKKLLSRKGFDLDTNFLLDIENRRKVKQTRQEELQAQRNKISKSIGIAKSKGEDAKPLFDEVASIKKELEGIENDVEIIQQELHSYLLTMPNILSDSVPDGADETQNEEVRTWGTPNKFSFEPKEHTEIGERLGGLDFNSGAKLSGSRFVVLRKDIAHLHRALANFMLDLHTREHGYAEINAPLLVDERMMEGTGQFPKFKEDQYDIADSNLWLIPTSEVSLTNLVRDTMLSEQELPLKYVSHSLCFRKEAGSYGKDTKGMIRMHQFEKVELVQVVKEEDSYLALESLVGHAEKVLQLLELPYRVVTLCSGDTGFSAAKTYDLEVWLPGQNSYREISSCSNTESFQARRMLARYKSASGKKFVHTLNGSGLAIGRTLVAVLENYQNEDGSVTVPEVLRPYMNKDLIK